MSHLYSYLQPPSAWVSCPLESRELLSLCLKKIKGLNKVHLVDAGFVWTEPHSKRIKVKLTIQKEVHVVNCIQTETSKITLVFGLYRYLEGQFYSRRLLWNL